MVVCHCSSYFFIIGRGTELAHVDCGEEYVWKGKMVSLFWDMGCGGVSRDYRTDRDTELDAREWAVLYILTKVN